MAELLEGLSGPSSTQNETIESECLDFDYISKCKDIKKLQLIFDTLKSGREGFYPEVTTHLFSNSQIFVAIKICGRTLV
jgi:hypothetical protein